MTSDNRPDEVKTGTLIDPHNSAIPDVFAAALAEVGIQPTAVQVPTVLEYESIPLEDLCIEPTHVRNGEGQSPFMVVTQYTEFPEWDDYEDYIGGIRCECVTEHGDRVAWTHYLSKKDSGEYSPIAQYCREARVPFAIKIARIETRKKNQYVYRPIAAILGADVAE